MVLVAVDAVVLGYGSLIAPAVQQIVSIAGDGDRNDVNKTQFDLFLLKH